MVKDFNLNLDSLQRFRRILPQIKSQAAKTAAKWGFQFGYLIIYFVLDLRRQGRKRRLFPPVSWGGSIEL